MKANFTLQTAKIVGTPSGGYWSQTHSFSPEDPQKKEKRGTLLAILVVRDLKEGIEAVSAGREILGRLHEEYYGNFEGSVFERLGESVKKVCQEQDGVSIVAAILLKNFLYLAIAGKGKIILKREGKTGTILSGEGAVQTASGIVKEGDLLLLGTERFFSIIGEGVLKVSLESGSLSDAVEILTPAILGRNGNGDAAAILSLLEKDETEELSRFENSEEVDQSHDEILPTGPIKKNNFFRKIFSRLSTRPKREIFIETKMLQAKKKIIFAVSIVLLILLTSAAIVGIKRKNLMAEDKKTKELITQAKEKLNKGKAAYLSSPKEAKALVGESLTIINEALKTQKRTDEVRLMKEQIDKFLSSSEQEFSLNEVPVFMNLNLINDGAEGVAIGLLEKNLAVLDKSKKKIYLLDYEKKSNQSLDVPVEEGRMMTGIGEEIAVFSNQGIGIVNIKNKSGSLKIKGDEEWKEIIGFSSFNRNFYLLDKKAGKIWRYLVSGDGYGPKKDWFVETPPDLSKAVSLAINGSIWVLENSSILKFNLGKQESFSLSKMTEQFEDPVKLYTSEEDENLYILDKGKGKVFIIAKTGEFKASYAWEGIKQATDLVAVESSKKIFLLSGAKIYEIGMK